MLLFFHTNSCYYTLLYGTICVADTSRTVEVKGSKSSYATVPGNEGVEYNITVQAFTLEGRQGPYSEPVVVAIEPHQGEQCCCPDIWSGALIKI